MATKTIRPSAGRIPESRFAPTPPCPECGAPMKWGAVQTSRPDADGAMKVGIWECDRSAHGDFCSQRDIPDYERAESIRAGSRVSR